MLEGEREGLARPGRPGCPKRRRSGNEGTPVISSSPAAASSASTSAAQIVAVEASSPPGSSGMPASLGHRAAGHRGRPAAGPERIGPRTGRAPALPPTTSRATPGSADGHRTCCRVGRGRRRTPFPPLRQARSGTRCRARTRSTGMPYRRATASSMEGVPRRAAASRRRPGAGVELVGAMDDRDLAPVREGAPSHLEPRQAQGAPRAGVVGPDLHLHGGDPTGA